MWCAIDPILVAPFSERAGAEHARDVTPTLHAVNPNLPLVIHDKSDRHPFVPLAFASRLDLIRPSATLAVAQQAAAMKAAGIDVISFSVGEPDFETPLSAKEGAKQAIDKGYTHYTAVRGIPPLLEAIAEEASQRRGVEISPSEIVVSCGAKQALFNLAVALYEPGDEVIIPAPYWVSYPEHALLFGAKPVVIPTHESQAFRVDPDELRKALSPRTKAVVLCTPSNPTGAAYDRKSLEAIAEAVADHDCWIIVDEIYGRLVYDGFEAVSLIKVAPELRKRMVIVDGASKSFAMTGWRVGWIIAPPELAERCEMIQGQSTSNICSIAQYAALSALREASSFVEELKEEFAKRRQRMVEGLNRLPGFRCRMPEGAFYAFASIEGLINRSTGGQKFTNDIEVATYLLHAAHVAVVPGSAFGAPNYLRFSYATSIESIDRGIERIKKALEKVS
ncbi:MAG: pyridoxal phosphate-dependent aminotransferase [Sandaracinaceae bacterium]|nr:pyridoxal phosphate-dependent aminotransferase [Sandaracinaceae bacterium]MDW8245170.1 pyridoxal phosphate-dependent aminotransferase [Sandaracinaceae bacterium]